IEHVLRGGEARDLRGDGRDLGGVGVGEGGNGVGGDDREAHIEALRGAGRVEQGALGLIGAVETGEHAQWAGAVDAGAGCGGTVVVHRDLLRRGLTGADDDSPWAVTAVGTVIVGPGQFFCPDGGPAGPGNPAPPDLAVGRGRAYCAGMDLAFTATTIEWRGPAPYVFARVPEE